LIHIEGHLFQLDIFLTHILGGTNMMIDNILIISNIRGGIIYVEN